MVLPYDDTPECCAVIHHTAGAGTTHRRSGPPVRSRYGLIHTPLRIRSIHWKGSRNESNGKADPGIGARAGCRARGRYAGVLQHYTPKDIPPLQSGLSMPTGYEGIVYLVTTVIAYNPTVVKQKNLPVPTSWEDLTKPAWKGRFSIDPGAVNWYDSLIKGMGHDQALALLKSLG